MAPAKIALSTQVLSIACSADGKRLLVTRIARGKHGAQVELDAGTLEPAVATSSKTPVKWTPCASVEKGLETRKRAWTVGEFGAGLWVHTLAGKRVQAPAPFNDPSLTVTAFAVSADERYALVGNSSGFVSVFEVATGEECFGQRLHRGHVTAACIAPDGRRAFTGSAGGELCVLTIPGA